jgi:hypothetical protein
MRIPRAEEAGEPRSTLDPQQRQTRHQQHDAEHIRHQSVAYEVLEQERAARQA